MYNTHKDVYSVQALALCRYLETIGSDLLSGQRVIELGAGTGLVGLVAHALGELRSVVEDSLINDEESRL